MWGPVMLVHVMYPMGLRGVCPRALRRRARLSAKPALLLLGVAGSSWLYGHGLSL